MNHDELLAAGNAADDTLYVGDRPRSEEEVSAEPRSQVIEDVGASIARGSAAENAYRDILKQAATLDPGPVRDYLLGKASLGLMLRFVRSGDADKAHEIWTARPPTTEAAGVAAAEAWPPDTRDANVLLAVAAYLHSLSSSDPERAALAVSSYLDRVVPWFSEHDPIWTEALLSNWWKHLEQIFGQPRREGNVILLNAGLEHIPPRWRVHVARRQEEFGGPVRRMMFAYPRPAPWALPALD